MDKSKFIENFRNAFGDYELPIGIWYSDQPVADPLKTKGCFIKDLKPARKGETVSLNLEAIACPGGKTYTGLTEMPPFIPGFVSMKEHYKQSPDLVQQFVCELNIVQQFGRYINFASIGSLDSFEGLEGLVFFAAPDVLSGLISWVHFDVNRRDAVSVPFASGCSAIVAEMVAENRAGGYRTFLGMFDPSVRPQVEANILSLAIPMSRFRELYDTFNESCLQGTHAWSKVKQRIEEDGI